MKLSVMGLVCQTMTKLGRAGQAMGRRGSAFNAKAHPYAHELHEPAEHGIALDDVGRQDGVRWVVEAANEPHHVARQLCVRTGRSATETCTG